MLLETRRNVFSVKNVTMTASKGYYINNIDFID